MIRTKVGGRPSNPAKTGIHEFSVPQRHTLVAQTAQILREGIRSCQWVGFLPGERELCERLLVSRTTLRSALTQLQNEGLLDVSERTRRRITVQKSGNSEDTRSRVVCLLSPEPIETGASLATHWIDHLRARLAESGMQLEIHVSKACFSAHPYKSLEKLVARAPGAIWVLYHSMLPTQCWFQRKHLLCLVAGTCFEEITLPSIDLNHRATCRHAAGLFLSKGCSRIYFLIHGTGFGDIESERGFLSAAEQARKSTVDAVICRHDGSVGGITRRLNSILSSSSGKIGIFVNHAPYAITAAMLILQRKLSMPDDVALICRDDAPYLEFTSPAIARYTHNPSLYARHLSSVVLELAQTRLIRAKPLLLMPRFRPGQTV